LIIPPAKPSKPIISVKIGEVWNRESKKYPIPPPTATLATSANGNSITFEMSRAPDAGRFRGDWDGGELGSSMATES